MKVLAVSSAGGHYSELKKITSNLDSAINIVTVTEDKVNDSNVDYFIAYSNRSRKIKYCFDFVKNLFVAYKILHKERPQKIISTGAHTAFFYFLIGKLFFKTTNIYIESYAKVTSKSLTYKLSHKFIDINIVQHRELQVVEKGSLYFGGVY